MVDHFIPYFTTKLNSTAGLVERRHMILILASSRVAGIPANWLTA
jgi:hypothetical protein